MRELLDASAQRMIKILENFAIHNEWTTISELSVVIGASERTIADDISNLQKRWGKSLNIEVSRKNGVYMHNRNSACIGQVFTDLFNDSTALLWIKELLFYPHMPLEFYETKLFVSRSTLIRLLTKINKFFSNRDIAIHCDNNTYQFIGKNEQYLRDFSASFLLELYGLNLQSYDISIDLNTISEIIISSFSQNLEPIELTWVLNDDISLTYWLMTYIISLVRENQGYTVICDYPVEQEIDVQKLAYLQEHFPNITIDSLRSIHQMMFNAFSGWNSNTEKILVIHESEGFCQRLFSNIPITYDEDMQSLMIFMLKSLYLSKKYRPTKTSTLFDRIYYFSLSLKRANALLYKLVEDNLKIFSQNVHIDINSNIADTLFWLCTAYPELSQFLQPKKALFIADFGMPHAKFLVNSLLNFFNSKSASPLQIDISCSPYSLSSAKTKNYDIIITTISNLHISHEKIFLINDYPSYDDYLGIYLALFG